MLNNRLLINGQFGYRDNATQANPSFIGDFDVQYLLYPNGNLALKVYNQTNDRYFTKSSLNTQGIGLIMKKDFNGLRDLFSSKKKRKRKKQLLTTDIQEYHSQKYKRQIEGFGLEVLLVEEHRTKHKAYDHATTTNH